MKKLIKADLSKVLELTAAYQPINCDSLKAELEILAQNGYSDDLSGPERPFSLDGGV